MKQNLSDIPGYQGARVERARQRTAERVKNKLEDMDIFKNGQATPKAEVWEQRIKCTLEFLEDGLMSHALDDTRGQWIKKGREVKLHYWTFLDDDKRQNLATLVCLSEAQRWINDKLPAKNCLHVAAPDDEIAEAVAWVIANNPHLHFLDEKPVMGYSNDDFIHNRITARLNFEIK